MRRQETHSYCAKKNATAWNKLRVIEALPDGIAATFPVCVQSGLHLEVNTRVYQDDAIPYFRVKPEFMRELEEELGIYPLSCDQLTVSEGDGIEPTIVILCIASCFHAGRDGSNRTS